MPRRSAPKGSPIVVTASESGNDFCRPTVVGYDDDGADGPIRVEYLFGPNVLRSLDVSTPDDLQKQSRRSRRTSRSASCSATTEPRCSCAPSTPMETPGTTTTLAERLAARLQTLAGLENVTVTEQGGDFVVEGFPAGGQALLVGSGFMQEAATPAKRSIGSIVLPADIGVVGIQVGDELHTVHLTPSDGTVASVRAALLAALEALAPNATVTLSGTGVAGDEWSIEIEDYDTGAPIAASYGLGFEAVSSTPTASQKVIERQGEDLSFAIDLDAQDRWAVYPTATDVSSSELFISPYRTVLRKGPRLIEKPVWADLDGDGVVEQTGETDWFETRSSRTTRARIAYRSRARVSATTS